MAQAASWYASNTIKRVRRHYARRALTTQVAIEFDGNTSTRYYCLTREVGLGGLSVSLWPNPLYVALRVTVRFPGRRLARALSPRFPASIVWKHGNVLGLRFENQDTEKHRMLWNLLVQHRFAKKTPLWSLTDA